MNKVNKIWSNYTVFRGQITLWARTVEGRKVESSRLKMEGMKAGGGKWKGKTERKGKVVRRIIQSWQGV